MRFESFEKKLYITRDIEGNPDYDDFKIIRKVEDRLSKHEFFIGLAPFGSAVSGYGGVESDIDLYVFYDAANRREELDVANDLLGVQEEIERSEKKRTHFITKNINLKSIISGLELIMEIGNVGEYTTTCLAGITRVVTGKKIDKYRESVKKELTKIPEKQRQLIKNAIIESLAESDRASLLKRKIRIPELSEE